MISNFKQRSLKPERLDLGQYSPEEYARWHKEMRFIHGILGEKRALRRSLLSEISRSDETEISILDVGAGSGALLNGIKASLRRKKTFLVAGELSREAINSIKSGPGKNGIVPVMCDSLRLPFADDSFDYLISTLFLHHLTDVQAVTLFNEMGRVARKKFFVIDPHRNAAAYYLYSLLGRFFLQRFTREDGALSILRSFKPEELRSLASRADSVNVTVTRSAAFRLVLSGQKKK
jgi:ubiquinone/menaquinone biosynthesis C-methylase UbiE